MLTSALKSNKETVNAFHAFLYSLVGEPATGSGLDRWKCPLNCYLAIWALREDGGFRSPADYTQVLAKWQYTLRQLHFMEAYQNQEKYNNDIMG